MPNTLFDNNMYNDDILSISVLNENASKTLPTAKTINIAVIIIDIIATFLKSFLFDNIGGTKYKISKPLKAIKFVSP